MAVDPRPNPDSSDLLGDNLSYFTSFFHLILTRIIIWSLGFLLVLFAFIGNKINQASVAERSKKRTKEEDKTTGDGCRSTAWQPSSPTKASSGQELATASHHQAIDRRRGDGHRLPWAAVASSWPTWFLFKLFLGLVFGGFSPMIFRVVLGYL